MRSIRLNNNIREIILSNLLKDKFVVPIEEFEKRKGELGERIYLEYFGPKTIKKFYDMPDGWLPTTNRIDAKLGTCSACFRVCESWDLSEVLPKAHYADVWTVRYPAESDRWITFPPGHPLEAEFIAITEDKRKAIEKRNFAHAEAWGVLTSCATLKKLEETWPEIRSFIPQSLFEEQILPALPIKSLNETFGLGGAKK